LEYGAAIWEPSISCGLNQVESIQRKFLNFAAYIHKKIADHPDYGYSPVLHKLNLNILVNRRLEVNITVVIFFSNIV